MFSSDILPQTKINPMAGFMRGSIIYKFLNDTHRLRWREEKFQLLDPFRVESGSTFPSDKLTLNMSALTSSKFVQWFILSFALSGTHDVNLLVEDSRRNLIVWSEGTRMMTSVF